MDVKQHQRLIEQIARLNDVDPETLKKLLELEQQFPTMSAYGARPKLRREIDRIVDDALAKEAPP